MNPNVKYSIQIYKNPKKGKPASGKKLLKRAMTGTIKEAGTHTIDLKQKVKLVKGEILYRNQDAFNNIGRMRSQ